MAEEDFDKNFEGGDAPPPSEEKSKKATKIRHAVLGVMLFLSVSLLLWQQFSEMFESKSGPENPTESAEAHSDPAHRQYVPLDPAFVVNFQTRAGRGKFLKAEMAVQVGSEHEVEDIKKFSPVIRNALILLLSRQFYEDIATPEGKERLRAEALMTIQNAMKKAAGKKIVEDLFFTSLVVQ